MSATGKEAPAPFYGPDLALIHDAGFGALARAAADLAIELLAPADAPSPPRVLDLGCGGGIAAAVLAESGASVLGIDLSPAQVELARTRVPGAEFRAGDLSELTGGERFDAILAVGEVLNYVPAGGEWPGLAEPLARCHELLLPGGLLILDLAGPGRVEPGRARSFALEPDWAVLMEAEEHEHPPALSRRITAFRRAGELWRRSDELHRLRLVPEGESRRALAAAGFTAEIRPGYRGVRFAPGHYACLARRG
jgi:SAM-dependent methyltransferase